jgi:preprotein translocase subunit Sec61beta
MARNRFTMPQSTAGLIRYFEESEEAIKIKPEYIIGISIAIVVFEIIVKFVA